jgi:hypothetical protein
VGSEAQAGSKTSVEKDHWSPYCKRSLQKKDGRGSAETVGSGENGSSGEDGVANYPGDFRN